MKHASVLAAALLLLSLPLLSGAVPDAPAGLSPEVRAHLDEARSLGLYRAPASERIHPHLVRVAAERPAEPVLVWVFFTDKGVGTRAGYERALGAARRSLVPHALRRRRALGPGLGLDFRDLPVNAAYVDRLREAGFGVRRVSRWVNAASIRTEAGRLADLMRFDFVREVTPVRVRTGYVEPRPGLEPQSAPGVLSAAAAPPDTGEAAFYGASFKQLDQIQAVALQRLGYTGAGVRVMMLDTGFHKTHPAFADADLIAEHDYVQGDGNTQDGPGDPSGQEYHGTGTWATLGGYAPGVLIGPAFAAQFVLAKTEDISQEVHSEEDNYVAALEWGDSLGVDVTSASLGYWTFDDGTGYTQADMDGNTGVITIAVDIAVAKGICCVNAAGNAGPDSTTIGTPADADSVISVGAVDSTGVIQGFSSRGPTADGRIKPEICARGRNTVWAQAWDLGYGTANGTSLATPLVGGLAALIKEAHPDWTGWAIREALIATGTNTATPDNAYGWGIARGLDAIDYTGFGSLSVAAPRMTLPFVLLGPADSAVVATFPPILTWSPSLAAQPGDAAHYTVLLAGSADFAGASSFDAGPDTSYALAAALTPGQTYWWKVEAVGDSGYVRRSRNVRTFTLSPSVAVGPLPKPGEVALAALPNPMRGSAEIGFRLPRGEAGAIEVFAVTGRRVRAFEVRGSGAEASVRWDGRDAAGREVPAGVYFVRLRADAGSAVRRLVRLP
jgi:hypothetical protein